MTGNVLGNRAVLRRFCVLVFFVGLYLVSGRAAATPARSVSESALDNLDTATGLALRSPVGGTTALEARREGPYIKYGSGNAAVLISFIGATSYGVKATCGSAAVAYAPQVCVATLVSALVLDFLAAFLLEGRDLHGRHSYNPHGLTLDMTHGEMLSKMSASLAIDSFETKKPHYIGGHSDPETGEEVQVFFIDHGDGIVGHRAVLSKPDNSSTESTTKRSEEHINGATMDYSWMYNNQKRFNHTDKKNGDVSAAGKSAAYDWYYNHGDTNRMCGGPVTDSGRLLDDVGIWYAGQPGGGSYPFQPGESASELGSCAADLNGAGYSRS